MRLSNLILCSSLFWATMAALGQTPQPTTAPAVPSAPAAQREPAGYLRVWHFASSFKEPVELAVTGAGAANLTLAYAASAGDLGSYRQLAPGRYRFAVRAVNPEALKPGSRVPAPNRSPELLPPVTVQVADGSFQTILLFDDQPTPKITVTDDSVAASNGGKRLRVFNFSTAEGLLLKVLNTNEILWPQMPRGMSERVLPKETKAINLALVTKLPNGREARQITEADFSSAPAVSIAITGEHDGPPRMQSFADAQD